MSRYDLFSVKLAVFLQLIQFGVFFLAALPFILAKLMKAPLLESVNLTVDTFYVFVIVSQIAGAIISYLIVHKRMKLNRLTWQSLGFRSFRYGRAVRYIAGYYILMLGGLFVIAAIVNSNGWVGESSNSVSSNSTIDSVLGFWPLILTTVILGPLIEEIVSRGILFKSLNMKYGLIASSVMAGTLFAVMHINPIQAMMVLPLGIYLCVMYDRLDSIVPGIILHATWNLLVVFISVRAI